jgi:hypothetical protein
MSTVAELKKEIIFKRKLKKDPMSVLPDTAESFKKMEYLMSQHLNGAIEKILPDVLGDAIREVLKDRSFLNSVIVGVVTRIPVPEDGEDGKNYVLTDEDKKVIAESIHVPIVEKVIEKIETIRERPVLRTDIIKEVTKEVLLDKTETGEDMVKKINALEIKPELQIDASHIKNLPVREGAKLGGIARVGLKLIWNTVLTGTVNGVNTVFTIPSTLPAPVDDRYLVEARGVIKSVDGGDFTISNSNRTVTFTSAPPTGSNSPRVILYQSH